MTTIEHRTFAPELEVRATAKGGDGRTVEGLAVPYNRTQRISAELTERFAEGAFRAQVHKPGKVHFAREHVSLGGTPIGRTVELREDARGLWGAWRVSATPAGDETLTLIEDGVLDELSIGFRAGRHRTLGDGVVERTSAHLVEVSVVLAGAYGRGATVSNVRAVQFLDEVQDVDEAESRVRAQRAAELLARVPLLPAGVLIG